jgi:hypothetical protein
LPQTSENDPRQARGGAGRAALFGFYRSVLDDFASARELDCDKGCVLVRGIERALVDALLQWASKSVPSRGMESEKFK